MSQQKTIIGRKLASMSNDDILTTWNALDRGWNNNEFWDQEHDITMDDWAEAVYLEKSERDL